MAKLVEKYKEVRTVANAERLLTYLEKHPMEVCLASFHELIVIEDARDLLLGKREAAAGLVEIRSTYL